MTAEQIAQKLRQAGFIANTKDNLVFVSLKNRQVCTSEITVALDWEVDWKHMWHTPAGVTVMGLEEQ
jgi:hypothetical protein